MKKTIKTVIAFIMIATILVSPFGEMIGETRAAAAVPSITYQAHVQDNGWLGTVKGGVTAGTTGQSKRLEGLKINLKYKKKSMITYRVHCQDIGW
ncbi:MAG: hypothetical protein K6B68_14060 [Eubacterium sp.]|nr:hypothetical protein [Eubacterium sp.]